MNYESIARDFRNDGYVIGTVFRRSYYNRQRGRTEYQWQAQHKGTAYVMDRYQYGYSPKEGDTVIIDPDGGRKLSDKLIAVRFVPADSTKKY